MKENQKADPWWLISNEKYFRKYGINRQGGSDFSKKEGRENVRTKMQKIESEDLEEKSIDNQSHPSKRRWKIVLGIVCIIIALACILAFAITDSLRKYQKPPQKSPSFTGKLWCNIPRHLNHFS